MTRLFSRETGRLPALALALALVLVAVPAGCGEDGGDVDEAGRLLRSGDAAIDVAIDEFVAVADLMERQLAACLGGAVTDPEAAREEARSLQERIDGVLAGVEEARETFSRVLTMEGVGRYREYATLRLEMLDLLGNAQRVVEGISPVLDQSLSKGRVTDAKAMEGAKRELIGIEMELSFVDAEAEELARAHGLLEEQE